MPNAPHETKDRLDRMIAAWQTLAPTKSVSGMTLAQFKDAVKASYDLRTDISTLETQLQSKHDLRDQADTKSLQKMQQVVNGVLADDAFGSDSDLYEAMGYVRDSKRKSGLTRKSKQPKKPPS